MLLKINGIPQGNLRRCERVFRDIPRTFRSVLCLVPFLCLVCGAIPGHAEFAREPLPSDWRGDDALAALAPLPDEEIPLGKPLVMASSLLGADLTGVPADPAAVDKEISRLADSVRPALRDMSNPRRVIAALNRFLFVEEGFTYDCVAGNPDNYLLDRVMKNKRGNCLGLTALYLLLAERLSLPLHGVYVPSHCFARDEGRYSRDFGLTGGRPYLRSLGRKEMIGVYLKSLGAAFSRKGMEDRALRLYREAAVFYPGLPDAYFNAGVSFHKKGLLDEAIAQYRRAF